MVLVAADASSPTFTHCVHDQILQRKRVPHPIRVNSHSLAFQSHGDSHGRNRQRRYDVHNDPFRAATQEYMPIAATINRRSALQSAPDLNDAPHSYTCNEISKSTPSTPQQFTNIISSEASSNEVSRRRALLQLLSISMLTTSLADPASASEIDTTGELYTPKNEMIKGGGSAAARGIKLKPMDEKESRKRKNESLLKSTGLIQNIYETRFITYLTRFLLVFDPAASAWWKKNSKVKVPSADEEEDDTNLNNAPVVSKDDIAKERFAEFAESVEVGLADYFLGPYGSYASVAAAKAGLAAAEPAKSVRDAEKDNSLWNMMFGHGSQKNNKKTAGTTSLIAKRKSREAEREATNLARQGILNLFSLFKARYTSIEEKQQLALLFSMISKPELQPVQEIRGLLGEIDNGTISEIELVDLSIDDDKDSSATAREFFRLSARQGGGFSKDDTDIIKVEPPAPLGSGYKPAKIDAVMNPTTRVLRINVVDGGQGYTVAPDVIVKQSGVSRQVEATAIIDRRGCVSEIIVLNPGFGYGGSQRQGSEPTLPTVEIRERKLQSKISNARQATSNNKEDFTPANAVAELEYKVSGIKIIDGGSGYLFDQPPEISVELPPIDPDWYAAPAILKKDIDEEDEDSSPLLASVTMMKSGNDGVEVDTRAVRQAKDSVFIPYKTLRSMRKDPIALLPSNIRPQFTKFVSRASADVIENGFYSAKSLPPVPTDVVLSSSTYRSIDPIFGGIGKAPVTKTALTLSSGQYSRLALAGAICTVLVRTALNPLELVKTKIQLQNDDEIMEVAKKKAASEQTEDAEASSDSKPAVGTTQLIQSLVEVRGPLSLFQSADITFITSIVFGLFGFGATELFRRSFSIVFLDESAAGPNEFILLVAAAFATLLTCFAGAPFEILRVRSMSQVEDEGKWMVPNYYDLVVCCNMSGLKHLVCVKFIFRCQAGV